MNNVNEVIDKEHCCGCTACYACCPVNAITMQPDDEGFLYPIVDYQECVSCGKCVTVCQNIQFYSEPQHIYASRSIDSLRLRSSSGGIFSKLAEKILGEGGGICAVGYSDDCKECLHKIIYTIDDLDDLRRAKFVQSKKYNIYREVELQLKQGRTMLFCGTPCEVGGLRQYLDNEYENLLTCDLICGCVSSPDVFRRYIDFLNEKYQSKVISVNFKDKRRGRREKSIAISFQNGYEYYNSILDDDYCVSFHSRYNIRPSCFACKYRSLARVSDITLGDFWAIEKYNKEFDDNKGTSFVLINSAKGERYYNSLENIDDHLMDIDLNQYCTLYNWCMHRNPTKMPKDERATFYSDVHTMKFDEMASKDLATIKEMRKQKKLQYK